MKFIADFHLHSKYSRATSPTMDLESLDLWGRKKGIRVLGTGDFTHPVWFQELKEKLEPAEPGLYWLKNEQDKDSKTRFLLTSEISCIYSKGGKVRKIHIIVFAPSFKIAEQINVQLGWVGNLSSDGRPILGLDAKELAKIVLGVSEDCFLVPAHAWTPWFSIFGSKSGFDSIEECFEDYSKHIYAIETGLSSNPEMNWRLSCLDNVALISNGDCHSPGKIGREANVFDAELSYEGIIEAIKNKDPQRFIQTVEFFPEEGKYHYDGHRACEISLSPEQTKKYNGICPVCQKPITVGVLSRINQLADRPEGFKPPKAIPFKSLVPLGEIIAESLGKMTGSKQVEEEYEKIIKNFKNEFDVLLNVPPEELRSGTLEEIAEGIVRVREDRIYISPGYDGVFGKISIFSEQEKKVLPGQTTLF